MSLSAAGHSRRRLGNTSTCPQDAFGHITKSASAAGRTRLQLVITLLYAETHLWASGCVAKSISKEFCN